MTKHILTFITSSLITLAFSMSTAALAAKEVSGEEFGRWNWFLDEVLEVVPYSGTVMKEAQLPDKAAEKNRTRHRICMKLGLKQEYDALLDQYRAAGLKYLPSLDTLVTAYYVYRAKKQEETVGLKELEDLLTENDGCNAEKLKAVYTELGNIIKNATDKKTLFFLNQQNYLTSVKYEGVTHWGISCAGLGCEARAPERYPYYGG